MVDNTIITLNYNMIHNDAKLEIRRDLTQMIYNVGNIVAVNIVLDKVRTLCGGAPIVTQYDCFIGGFHYLLYSCIKNTQIKLNTINNAPNDVTIITNDAQNGATIITNNATITVDINENNNNDDCDTSTINVCGSLVGTIMHIVYGSVIKRFFGITTKTLFCAKLIGIGTSTCFYLWMINKSQAIKKTKKYAFWKRVSVTSIQRFYMDILMGNFAVLKERLDIFAKI